MSADNWALCPRCARIREEKLASMDIDIANAYGSVTVEEFDRMRSERDAFAATKPERTFREDYEFWGAEEGELNASYRGGCTVCGLTHKFEHSEAFDTEADR